MSSSSIESPNRSRKSPKSRRSRLSLTKDFYLQMLGLEASVSNSKQLNIERIHELIEKYAACVEYFDNASDPIKVYFLEKIQITLASVKILNLLVTKTNSSCCSSEKLNTTNTQLQHQQQILSRLETDSSEPADLKNGATHQELDDQLRFLATEPEDTQHSPIKSEDLDQQINDVSFEENDRQSIFQESKNASLLVVDSLVGEGVIYPTIESTTINHTTRNEASQMNLNASMYDDKMKRSERSKRVDLFLKLRHSKTKPNLEDQLEPKEDIKKIIYDFEEVSSNNDNLVKRDIDEQMNAFHQRILQKNKAKMNADLKAQSSCFTPRAGITINPVLRENQAAPSQDLKLKWEQN